MTLEARVRATGLLEPGRPVVVLLSGGPDSVCLLDLAVAISGEATALHVNYGLRPDAGADEAHCRALCEQLGVPLAVHAAGPFPGANLQAWARAVRYAAALALTGDVATGHTATDQVETVLYRLAASPGRRALLGMPERDGRVVRPLLGVTRAETAAHCRRRGLPWREDSSNDDPVYARNRTRHGLVPALRALHPAAEANVLVTLARLRDEAAVLDGVVEAALRAAGWQPGGGVPAAALQAMPPALQRLALQRLADDAAGGRARAVGHRAEEVLALAHGGTRTLDLGGRLRAVLAYGELRVEPARPRPTPPQPRPLPVPGRIDWAGGELTAERGAGPVAGEGTLDAAVATTLEVRPWRAGDRMRPLGLDGSRSLQDLFTDRKVPRELRALLPVVVCGGDIAWVPGVATGERFKVTARTVDTVRLAWRAG